MNPTVFKAATAISEGNAADKAARFKAKQIERNAIAKRAAGTRTTQEGLRKGRVLQSDAIAQMAAGGGAFDAGSIEQLAGLKQVTDYNALTALFESEEQAKGMELAAKGARMEGKMAKKKGQRKAIGTIMEDVEKAMRAGV